MLGVPYRGRDSYACEEVSIKQPRPTVSNMATSVGGHDASLFLALLASESLSRDYTL